MSVNKISMYYVIRRKVIWSLIFYHRLDLYLSIYVNVWSTEIGWTSSGTAETEITVISSYTESIFEGTVYTSMTAIVKQHACGR